MMNLLFLTEEVAFDLGAYIKEIFTPELITTIIAMIGAFSSVIALIKNARSLAKKNNGTINDVITAIREMFNSASDEQLERVIRPIIEGQYKQNEINKIFAQVLALSQENTPESKIAILQLLQSIGQVDNKVIEEAKDTINKEQEENEAKKEQALKDLEEFEKQEQVEKEQELKEAGRV